MPLHADNCPTSQILPLFWHMCRPSLFRVWFFLLMPECLWLSSLSWNKTFLFSSFLVSSHFGLECRDYCCKCSTFIIDITFCPHLTLMPWLIFSPLGHQAILLWYVLVTFNLDLWQPYAHCSWALFSSTLCKISNKNIEVSFISGGIFHFGCNCVVQRDIQPAKNLVRFHSNWIIFHDKFVT